MTQEEKELSFKDLCGRLPYHVYVKVWLKNGTTEEGFLDLEHNYADVLRDAFYYNKIKDIKPYLRPMSSMSEEEFAKLKEYSGLKYSQLDLASYQNGTYKCLDFYLSEVPSYVVILVFEWLSVHHFDYRGLIERGLAIEVTKENNPYGNL